MLHPRLTLILLLSASSAFGQSSAFFKSSNDVFNIYLPSGWIKQAPESKFIQFALEAPIKKKTDFPSMLVLETGTLAAGYENASIKVIAKEELAMLKNQYKDKITVLKDAITILNNKLWWLLQIKVDVSKKNSYYYKILKTIHNKVTYTLTFKSEKDEFFIFENELNTAFTSFMFYTADETQYADNTPSADPNAAKKILQPLSGSYVTGRQTKNGFEKMTLLIGDSAGGKYFAREIREIISNGKSIIFEAALQAESVTATGMILSTDEVSRLDTGVYWRKMTYDLRIHKDGLSGSLFSRDSSFKPSNDIVFERQNKEGIKNEGIGGKSVANAPTKAAPNTGKVSDPGLTGYGKVQGNFTGYGDYVDKGTVVAALNIETGAVSRTAKGEIDLKTQTYNLKLPAGKYLIFLYIDFKNGTYGDTAYYTDASVCPLIDTCTSFLHKKAIVAVIPNKVLSNVNPDDWSWKDGVKYDNSVTAAARAIEMPSATDLEVGLPAGSGQPTLVPSATDRILSGGKTPEDLGKILLTALKNGDKKTWYSCVLNDDFEKVSKDFDYMRKTLKSAGLTDWKLTEYSRTTYHDSKSDEPSKVSLPFFKVEFIYGKDFIGWFGFSGSSAVIHKGKYVLRRSIKGVQFVRREEYR